MKRLMLAAAAAVGVLAMAGESRADFGGAPPVMQAGGPQPPQAKENTAGRFGLLPAFQRVVWWGKKEPAGCSGPGCGGGVRTPHVGGYAPPMGGQNGPGMGYPGPGSGYPGPGMGQPQGTLVFPNHQFSRSPRDFFMWEPK